MLSQKRSSSCLPPPAAVELVVLHCGDPELVPLAWRALGAGARLRNVFSSRLKRSLALSPNGDSAQEEEGWRAC
jgi:hypothetical protein